MYDLKIKVEQCELDRRLSEWRPLENRILIADDIPEIEKEWAFIDAVLQAIYSCLHYKENKWNLPIKTFIAMSAFELYSVMVQARLIKGRTTSQWFEYAKVYFSDTVEDPLKEVGEVDVDVPDEFDDPF